MLPPLPPVPEPGLINVFKGVLTARSHSSHHCPVCNGFVLWSTPASQSCLIPIIRPSGVHFQQHSCHACRFYMPRSPNPSIISLSDDALQWPFDLGWPGVRAAASANEAISGTHAATSGAYTYVLEARIGGSSTQQRQQTHLISQASAWRTSGLLGYLPMSAFLSSGISCGTTCTQQSGEYCAKS